MTVVAHLDLVGGSSGDMTISALVHAGRRMAIDVEAAVVAAIETLGFGCGVTFVDDERGGLACLRTEIKSDDRRFVPDELRAAIERCELTAPARKRALSALDGLVTAEATVHSVDVESVHLHELGSADTAADLAGVAAAFGALGVEDVTATSVPMPSGTIDSAHGRLPLPAPVTLELLKGATVHGVDFDKELVTPTGAAILRTYVSSWKEAPSMRLIATGIGGGTRTTPAPNICRVFVGELTETGARTESCVLLETNIDDQTPEAIGYVVELLLERGALDAWVSNVTMKKSRPAFVLSALVRPEDEASLTEAIFRETTTLGVRRRDYVRSVLARELLTVDVDGNRIAVKIGRLGDEVVNVSPEFSDCVAASRRTGQPVKVIYERAQHAARGLWGS